jgi:hypothetical protein
LGGCEPTRLKHPEILWSYLITAYAPEAVVSLEPLEFNIGFTVISCPPYAGVDVDALVLSSAEAPFTSLTLNGKYWLPTVGWNTVKRAASSNKISA